MRVIARSLRLGLLPLALLCGLALPAAAPAPLARAAAFGADTLVVYRVGDGADPLTDSGNPIFLDEFDPAGSPGSSLLQSIALPTAPSGNDRAIFASDRVGEGLITRSADGRQLILTGFSAQALGLPGTTGNVIPRVIAQVGADGATIISSTSLEDYASGSVPTSAASLTGFDFWAVGGAGGMRFTTGNTITSTQLFTAPASLNQVALFDGQLYASTAFPADQIGTISGGAPTSGPQTFTPLAGLPATGDPFGFFFADLSPAVAGVDTLYVAYEDAGISKFALVGGAWVARGTVGADADDYRGLTAVASGQSVTLYATRKASELVRLEDSSGYDGALAGVPALIATAAANTAFRGVALAPRAASALAPDLTVSAAGPASAVVGAPYSYALSVRNTGVIVASNVTVRLTLPPGLTYVGASGPAGFSAIQASGVVTFTGGAVGVGGQADLLVSVAAAVVGPVTLAAGAAVVDPTSAGDPNGAIAELDEANNSSLQTVVTGVGPAGGPPADTTAPDTLITGQPAATTTASAATFTFSGSDDVTLAADLLFQCSLDGAAFGPCTSPQSYAGLGRGAHTFLVRAVDAAGNPDASPAAYTWTVRTPLYLPFIQR